MPSVSAAVLLRSSLVFRDMCLCYFHVINHDINHVINDALDSCLVLDHVHVINFHIIIIIIIVR